MSIFNYLVISWALGLTAVIVYVYVRWLRRIWREYRGHRETKPCADCDHCARLRRKSKEGYNCENVMHFFKKPPEYCSNYRPRKEQLDEEIDRRANERVNALISELVNDEMLRAWDEDLEGGSEDLLPGEQLCPSGAVRGLQKFRPAGRRRCVRSVQGDRVGHTPQKRFLLLR